MWFAGKWVFLFWVNLADCIDGRFLGIRGSGFREKGGSLYHGWATDRTDVAFLWVLFGIGSYLPSQLLIGRILLYTQE